MNNKDNMNMDGYENSIKFHIEQSMNSFEQAKCDAINHIRNMDCYDATEFGTGFMMKVDRITKYATQVRTYEHALRKYKEKNGDVNHEA